MKNILLGLALAAFTITPASAQGGYGYHGYGDGHHYGWDRGYRYGRDRGPYWRQHRYWH